MNPRGILQMPVLIAIALGLVVLGGGAYFVMQQSATSPTSNESQGNETVADSAQEKWKTYTNTQLNYSAQFPEDWLVTSDDKPPYYMVTISSPVYTEIATCTGQPECENTPVIQSGGRFEISTTEQVSGSVADFMNLMYSTAEDNVAFKAKRWATVDGKQALVVEHERWMEPSKGAFQTIGVMIPNGQKIIQVTFKFNSFNKENEEIFTRFLKTFDVE